MSRQSLLWPLVVIGLALALIFSMLRNSSLQPGTLAFAQSECTNANGAYPCSTATAQAVLETQTAAASAGVPLPTQTTGTAITSTATGGTATTTGTARTATPVTVTVTGTPPTATLTRQVTTTNAPSETRGPTAVVPTTTPVVGALVCVPGSTVMIEGRGPRNTPLLVYFGSRAVGGGLSDAAGNYRLQITIGAERAAFYPVLVRVRGTQQVVRELTCLVPYFTPTPTRRPRTPLG